jgi:hypothetical protein
MGSRFDRGKLARGRSQRACRQDRIRRTRSRWIAAAATSAAATSAKGSIGRLFQGHHDLRKPFSPSRRRCGTNRLLKNSKIGRRCATFESKIPLRRIFCASRNRALNQSCASRPPKNLFQQPAKRLPARILERGAVLRAGESADAGGPALHVAQGASRPPQATYGARIARREFIASSSRVEKVELEW